MSAQDRVSNNINIAEGPSTPGEASSQPDGHARDEQSASKIRRPAAMAGCGSCDARWTGSRTAHCSGCHRTFSSPSAFDTHRSIGGEHGLCADPETIAELEFRDDMWRYPQMTDEELARRTGAEQ